MKQTNISQADKQIKLAQVLQAPPLVPLASCSSCCVAVATLAFSRGPGKRALPRESHTVFTIPKILVVPESRQQPGFPLTLSYLFAAVLFWTN